tara:strand:- start:300 stop:1526 length:1227 start_codon:yes stop_codon:yes gene_type:complete
MKLFSIVLATLFINCISGQTFTNYDTTSSELIDNVVNWIDIDANDNVWMATQNGISKFDGTNWESYTTTSHPGLIDNNISSICVMSNGDIWAGSDIGVSKFNGSQWISFTELDGLGDNRVFHISQSSDGRIWFGEYDGITIYDGSNWISYNMSDGLPFGGIYYSTFETNGDAWLASDLGGLIHFDGVTFTEYTENEGLINDGVRAIAIDNQNNKWTGTEDGISVLNNSNVFDVNHTMMLLLPPPDTLNPVEDIKINSAGDIWAGIYVDYLVTEGGIAMFDGTSWTDFDVSDGLIGPVVRSLAIDSQDAVWVATSTGVSKLSGVVGLKENINKNNIEIYPNPSSSHVNISFSTVYSNAKLCIYNANFQLIRNIDITDNKKNVVISIEEFDNGIYFLKFGNTIEKLIIQH